MYSTYSARDTGTLYQARNLIDARNVTNNPANNYYAASEFLDKFLDAYLIVGALDHFGMPSLDAEPTVNLFDGLVTDTAAKKAFILKTAQSFVHKHVMNEIPQLTSNAPTSSELRCRYCGKTYIRPSYLKQHEEKQHGHVSQAPVQATSTAKEDFVYNYTHNVLVLLLLRKNHNDAIHLGDGARVVSLYKFFYLFYNM